MVHVCVHAYIDIYVHVSFVCVYIYTYIGVYTLDRYIYIWMQFLQELKIVFNFLKSGSEYVEIYETSVNPVYNAPH